MKRQELYSQYIKNTKDSLFYREAWFRDGKVYFHDGKTGQKGIVKTNEIPRQLAHKIIESFNKQAIRDDFIPITPEHLNNIVIRFTVTGLGTMKQLDIRHAVEDEVDEALGWTGNGRCNGGDAGGGTQQIDCQVLSIEAAIRTLTPLLKAKTGSFDRIEIAADDRIVVVSDNGRR